MNADPLYQVLYVSTLAPGRPLTVVAEIAQRARVANASLGITAFLSFDGQRFCQLLEGNRKAVLSLTERIRSDPRHCDVEILHHGNLAARRFEGFKLAFTAGDEETCFDTIVHLDGEAAVIAFDTLRQEMHFLA